MSECEGRVARLEGDFAVVEVTSSPAACVKCGDNSSCGKAGTGPRQYSVPNTAGVRVGDRVVVAVPEGAVLKAAVLSYLLPLAFVLAGAAAGTAWGGDGLPAVGGAVCGLLAGLAALRMTNAIMARRREPWLSLRVQRRVVHFEKEA